MIIKKKKPTEEKVTIGKGASEEENKKAQKHQLPLAEDYNECKKAKTPFLCVTCNKKFTKSTLNSHVKTKHPRAKNVKVNCHICERKFDKHTGAQDHVAKYHANVFKCTKCSESFSDFDRLKSHLKAAHDSEWPWICGFCDLVLLYDLEFEVHVRQHTEKSPYDCPLCSRLFSDNSRLREHLARQHLPSKEDQKQPSLKQQQEEQRHQRQQQQIQKQQEEAFARLKTMTENKRDNRDDADAENAVSREIADLLLNLQASRTAAPPSSDAAAFGKPEDLSIKTVNAAQVPQSNETAMDLTKSSKTADYSAPLPASISKLVKTTDATLDLSSSSKIGSTVTLIPATTSSSSPTAAAPVSSDSNYPGFYPSLATMATLGGSSASNYLLQNILLGKIQQIAASGSPPTSTSTKASPASTTTINLSSSLPTHPIPAQSLTLDAPQKPPASVLKAANGASSSFGNTPLQLIEGNPATNIPLLCGQIVQQLNGLLFLVHSLNNPQIELNLQQQLTTIFTRLQEVVNTVEQQTDGKKNVTTITTSANNEAIQKQLSKLKESKQKEEEKIAKHIQDYQRALLQQQQDAAKIGTTITPITAGSAANGMAAAVSANLLQQQHFADPKIMQIVESSGNAAATTINIVENGIEEADSNSPMTAKNRRRGRPPKNSNSDLIYSPPEKRARSSSITTGDGVTVTLAAPTSQNLNDVSGILNGINSSATVSLVSNGSGIQVPNSSSAGGAVQTSKGGKGIRNRVFCGECPGCLQNDDCGKCRYCKDKTKFGGQNRLRQKCLHRRCQMDTHRKRHNNSNANNSNAANNSMNQLAAASAVAAIGDQLAANGLTVTPTYDSNPTSRQSPSPNAIYSGVALARLASQQQLSATSEKKPLQQLAKAEISKPVFPTSLIGKFCLQKYHTMHAMPQSSLKMFS